MGGICRSQLPLGLHVSGPRAAGGRQPRCTVPRTPVRGAWPCAVLDLPASPASPGTASAAAREAAASSTAATPSAAAAAGDHRHLLARQHLVVLAAVSATPIGAGLYHVRDALAPVRWG